MKLKHPDLALWICFVALLVVGIVASIYSVVNPAFDGLSLLSGYATFAIALLTVVYVITTRHQLHIMTRQLSEMVRDRELQAQPLPWPIFVRVYSERPRLLIDPDHPNRPQALTRHNAEVRLKNLSSSAAVSVDISSFLVVPGDAKPTRWSCTSCRAEVLEEKHEYPEGEQEKNTFLFWEDGEGLLLTSLLENKLDKLPMLHVQVCYRNILGACFALRRIYKLYPKKDTQDTIKSWLERLHNFPLRHKEDLDKLTQMRANNDPRTEEIYDGLKAKCLEGLSEEEIEFDAWPIPATGDVSCLTTDEYKKVVSKIRYGIMIDSSYLCPSSQKKDKR